MKRNLWMVAAAAVTFMALDASAAAESSAVIVVGKADAHARTVVNTAIVSTVQSASWSVLEQPFTAKDNDAILGCMSAERPWPCIAPFADGKGVSRLVVVQVDPERADGDTQLVMVGQLVTKGDDIPSIGRRVCNHCGDTEMTRNAVALASDLLKAADAGGQRTMIAVQTVPRGAIITLDGMMVGDSDRKIGTHAGRHTVMLQLSGYTTAVETIDVAEGQTTVVSRALEPEGGARHDDGDHPYRLSVFVTALGTAAIAGGAVVYFTSGPSGDAPTYRDWRPAGVGLSVLGAAAAGYGIYMLLHVSPRSTAPVVGVLDRGGFVAWGGSF